MRKEKLFAASAALLTILACQKEPQMGVPSGEPELLPIELSMELQTKASNTTFDQYDEVGIYVVNYSYGSANSLQGSGNYYDNVKMTYDYGWTQENQMYWMDKSTPADFYCYHPYSSTENNALSHAFETRPDQSLLENYKASDFLWGKLSGAAPTKETLSLTTRHILSNIKINLVRGKGFTYERWTNATKSVKVKNVYTDADINLSDGRVYPTGMIQDVIPYQTETDAYKAVIVPQTISDGQALVSITVDNVEFLFKKGFTFVPGKQHNFTIRVNRTGSGIDVGIEDWGNDGTDNGGDAE